MSDTAPQTAEVGVITSLLTREVFDNALFPVGGSDLRLLWMVARIMGGVAVVSGALGIVQTYRTNRAGQGRVMRDLRDNLYRHLRTLSLGFFTGTRAGDIQPASPATRLASRTSSPTPCPASWPTSP